MAFTLPPLPYAPDALEPYIDKTTMEIGEIGLVPGLIDKRNLRYSFRDFEVHFIYRTRRCTWLDTIPTQCEPYGQAGSGHD